MGVSLDMILKCEELTAVESLILAAIFFETKGAIKPSHLAQTFQTTRSNVSHRISSLEAKGLVERKVDSDDARAFRLALRPQGRQRAVRVVGILDRRFASDAGANECGGGTLLPIEHQFCKAASLSPTASAVCRPDLVLR